MGENLYDTEFGTNFLNMTPKIQASNKKIYNFDFIKIKNTFVLKDTIKRVKE